MHEPKRVCKLVAFTLVPLSSSLGEGEVQQFVGLKSVPVYSAQTKVLGSLIKKLNAHGLIIHVLQI